MSWKVILYNSSNQIPPNTSGVYILFVNKIVDYVGQSHDARKRLEREHHVYSPEIHTRVALILEPNYETRLSLERYFNKKYNPPNSYIGTEKQAATWNKAKLLITAQQRRQQWKEQPFDEFDAFLDFQDKSSIEVELSQTQLGNSALGVPSIIAFGSKDIRKR